MRPGTVLTFLMVAVAVGAVALVAVVKSIDMPAYRRLMTEAFAAQTGHQVEIGGTLALKLSWSPRLVATDVRMADAAGDASGIGVRIARVEAEIGLLPLLRREIAVRRLRLFDVDLQLERGIDGGGDWRLDHLLLTPPAGGGNIPHTTLSLGRVTVEKGRLRIRGITDPGTSIAVEQLVLDAEGGPLSLTLTGSIEQRRFDLSAVGGSIADITRQLRPFPLKLKASSGGLVATVDGTIGRPSAGEGLNLKLAVEGTEIADAAKLLWGDLPGLGPFRAVGRLNGTLAQPELAELDLAVGKKDVVRITAKSKGRWPLGDQPLKLVVSAEADDAAALAGWFGANAPPAQPLRASAQLAVGADDLRLTQLSATIGSTDVAGQMRLIARPGAPPSLTAILESQHVSVADFGLRRVGAVAGVRSPPTVPDQPIRSSGLRDVDVDVHWTVEHAEARGLTLHQLAARLRLHDMRFRIDPFSARLGEGTVRGGLSLDGGAEAPLVLVLDAQGVDLAAALDAAGLPGTLGRREAVNLNLAGKRRSLHVLTTSLGVDTKHSARKRAPWLPPENKRAADCLAGDYRNDGARKSSYAASMSRPAGEASAGRLLRSKVALPMLVGTVSEKNACAAAWRRVKQPVGRFLGMPARVLPYGMLNGLQDQP